MYCSMNNSEYLYIIIVLKVWQHDDLDGGYRHHSLLKLVVLKLNLHVSCEWDTAIHVSAGRGKEAYLGLAYGSHMNGCIPCMGDF